MFELLLLSTGLAMDAVAVSIGLGASQPVTLFTRFKIALLFGAFQGLMPMIGYMAGLGMAEWVQEVDHWVAWGILLLLGAKMIYEAFQEGVEETLTRLTNRVLLTLALATSIDALAAGFTLTLMPFHPNTSCLVIGTVTFVLSLVGTEIGKRLGTLLESKAEIAGGVILIAIGFHILLDHTHVL